MSLPIIESLKNLITTNSDDIEELSQVVQVISASSRTFQFQIGDIYIESGVTSCACTANTPTGTTITFSKTFSKIPVVFVNPSTSVPGTTVTGVAATSVSTTGCEIYVTRTNSSATNVVWMAVGTA